MMKLTTSERRTLLAILHGAQDDDDGSDPQYTAALTALLRKTTASQGAESDRTEGRR